MTREEIIRMARSDDWAVDVSLKWDDFFVRFANLVAAAEREALAQFFQDHWREKWTDLQIAEAIRARGEKA
jgi:hypothetical protein